MDQRLECLSCYRFALTDYYGIPIAKGYCELCFNFFASLKEPMEVRKFVELGPIIIEGGAMDAELVNS